MPYNPLSGSAPVGQLGWRAPLVFLLPSPVLVAHASMPTPALIIAIAIQPSSMAATAIFRVPGVSSSDLLTAPISLATAAMLAPTVNVFSVITAAPPAMAATAAMRTPAVASGVGITAPLLAAIAAMRTPTVTVLNPVAFSAVSAGAHNAAAATTCSCTVATKANDYVIAVFDNSNTASTVSSVTCGGVAMTLLASMNYNNAAGGTLFMYGLAGVAAGTLTVTLTYTSAQSCQITAAAYSNVASVGAVTTAFGASGPCSKSATCAAGQMIVNAFGTYEVTSTAWTSVSGGTNRYNNASAATGGSLILSDATANATFAGTAPSSGTQWAGISAVLSPA